MDGYTQFMVFNSIDFRSFVVDPNSWALDYTETLGAWVFI